MKKLLISLFIALFVLSVSVYAGTCGSNLTWTLDDEGTLTISGTGDMWDYTDIDNRLPWRNSNVKHVVIESGVTSIGTYAFYFCKSLTSIEIPDSVTSIGEGAFRNYSRLTSIVIPDSVTSIGGDAFMNCTGLTSVVIGNGVTSIGRYAFYNCRSLTSIKYSGSESQWNAISKASDWDYNTGNYTITYNYAGV